MKLSLFDLFFDLDLRSMQITNLAFKDTNGFWFHREAFTELKEIILYQTIPDNPNEYNALEPVRFELDDLYGWEDSSMHAR